MSQDEVYQFMVAQKKGMTSKQIANELKKKGCTCSNSTITTNLTKLVRTGFLLRYRFVGDRHKYIMREKATVKMKKYEDKPTRGKVKIAVWVRT
jgi:predicted transcriptional regulator